MRKPRSEFPEIPLRTRGLMIALLVVIVLLLSIGLFGAN